MSARAEPAELGILSSDGPTGHGRVVPAPAPTLRDRLRKETEPAHLAAEAAADLDWCLDAVERYAGLLLAIDAAHRACEPALTELVTGYAPGLVDGWTHRWACLRADIDALAPGITMAAVGIASLPSPDHVLGAWYVFEGAALGGLVIAAQARRRLPAARDALRYFEGEGHGTARRFRAVQAVLESWGAPDEPAADRVVTGARTTFATLRRELTRRAVA